MNTNTQRIVIFKFALMLFSLMIMSAADSKDVKDRWDSGEFADWRNKPHEPFSKGRESFDQVKNELLKHYVDAGLTEDDLYRAAVQGMLTNLDPKMAAWNRLMSPAEIAELNTELKGQLVGIGVQITFNENTGYGEVLSVIPGTSGEKAGIVRGDQILKIDGKIFRGGQLRDMVYAMRGKSGTTVELAVLHEDQIRKMKLRREAIAWETVEVKVLDDHVGLVNIHYFIDATPKKLAEGLANLAKKNLKGVIIDLRGNEGGVFERAVESIQQLVPNGRPLVKVIDRSGKEKTIASKADPILKGLPLVVMMNGSTKSGAEVMAAALKQSAAATTIGRNTFGKWSAQKLDELPNKHAYKFTTVTFLPPDGQNLSGKGLAPDIMVDMDENLVEKMTGQSDASRLQQDTQLRAAWNLIRMK